MMQPSFQVLLLLMIILRATTLITENKYLADDDVELLFETSTTPKYGPKMEYEEDAEVFVELRDQRANPIDLAKCESDGQVLCLQTGTCESFQLVEPQQTCRRRFCPKTETYCLDFDGCMMQDSVYSLPFKPDGKKCPMPLSLCANMETCQYARRLNYDDLREKSLKIFNCSVVTETVIFQHSNCSEYEDCHWTRNCCPDGRMNKQCAAYRTVMPAKLQNEPSLPAATQSSSSVSNPPVPTSTVTPTTSSNVASTAGTTTTLGTSATTLKTSVATSKASSPQPEARALKNATSKNETDPQRKTTIYINNDYETIVGNGTQMLQFLSDISSQLLSILNTTDELVRITVNARPGSIILDVNMTPVTPDLDDLTAQAHAALNSLLKRGTLMLKDLNGTMLTIPAQENGKPEDQIQDSYTTVIISVTAVSLGATLLLMFWILWNNKKQKGVQPLKDGQQDESWMGEKETNFQANEQRNHFLALGDPQIQWEIFQKSFDKPGYVWQTQDELWKDWPGILDVSGMKSTPLPARYEEPDPESKHI